MASKSRPPLVADDLPGAAGHQGAVLEQARQHVPLVAFGAGQREANGQPVLRPDQAEVAPSNTGWEAQYPYSAHPVRFERRVVPCGSARISHSILAASLRCRLL
jgi:hypothetical protein